MANQIEQELQRLLKKLDPESLNDVLNYSRTKLAEQSRLAQPPTEEEWTQLPEEIKDEIVRIVDEWTNKQTPTE